MKTEWKEGLEKFTNEINGGGTAEKLIFYLIDAVVELEQTTKRLTWVLIVLTVALVVLTVALVVLTAMLLRH